MAVWEGRLCELNWKVSAAMSIPVVLADDMKDLLASSDVGANFWDRAETGPIYWTAMKSPGG